MRPQEYPRLLLALRTPGRGVVIEGPSGIGKTTSVVKALNELGLDNETKRLTARRLEDREKIRAIPRGDTKGTILIDDFHRLDLSTQETIADYLKTLADDEKPTTKVILVGINRAGDSLVSFARDLSNRIEIIRFETNPDEFVEQLVSMGETTLNISIKTKPQIVANATGSFYLAQMLSSDACLASGVTERCEAATIVGANYEAILRQVMDRMKRSFKNLAITFASGPKLRRGGRAPYLHILRWLAESNDWAVELDRMIAIHPEQRGSVGQVVEKDYLKRFLEGKPELAGVLHYGERTRVLSAEDPQFVFYLRNLSWKAFAKEVGYVSADVRSEYDFALSFSGEERALAELMYSKLAEREFAVFYDKNEQERILAENVEEYLAPIYRHEADFVVPLLSPSYPKRVWARFESDQFKQRFGEGAVIPVWFTTAPPGIFDESRRVGGFTYDPAKEMEAQVDELVELCSRKLTSVRVSRAAASISVPLDTFNE